MPYIEGESRSQLMVSSLDDMVDENSIARIIDQLVKVLDLQALGFENTQEKEQGRPSYPPDAMAKLYIYGYCHGVRSSRKLEKETHRNLEVIWLMERLKPDHKTIAEFRRRNIKAIEKLFAQFTSQCLQWALIDGQFIAVDGTKIRASNSKKKNYNEKNLKRRLKMIEETSQAYLRQIEENDSGEENGPVGEQLEALTQRKGIFEQMLEQIKSGTEKEVSTTDPDARLMENKLGGLGMGYNVQSAVDGKFDLIINYSVSGQPSDQGQLRKMMLKLKRHTGLRQFTLVADKGYYNGPDFKSCTLQQVDALVARQKPSNPKTQPKHFHTENFLYDAKTDTYTCPEGHILTTTSKKNADRRKFQNKQACQACPFKTTCCKNQQYRTVSRSQYAKYYAQADARFKEGQAEYKKRQMMVEHPFGTIKRDLNGSYFLLRTKKKVRAEVALLFLAYNLIRVMNILGFDGFMAAINSWSSAVLSLPSRFVALFSVTSKKQAAQRIEYPLYTAC